MFCMIDIETIGTEAESIVVSVGAVNFNKEGILGKKLWVLNMKEQRERGRVFDQATLDWWQSQSKEARSVFKQKERVTVDYFIEDFKDFLLNDLITLKENFNSVKPVGNGANFDITIIEHLIMMYRNKDKAQIPWKFYNVYCFRTLDHLFKLKEKLPREGTHHDALDDAEYQAKCFMKIWEKKK